ncbi:MULTISPECIES: aminotransferase class I/II-fold pyridoxal phosphate-dependent enzyme [Micrococcaceae]|uniref:aminotransferase class I/II-fold pyridoxal phosphate-dependent enzyme n=1 Tax=Micrococcaceae TaxID=1268 RepID=UPI00160F0D8D|nr:MULTISPECIES: aminotransferase class I/II-fold pyridoxal phosphate-dependent enzyme [Micrococcaceae]MBB5748445.1 N-succinyldiaminopimelate aminotransferase [Micrococcus sp. TA1]HRO30955.1 aminotransferase class I/II-fold pyridoxal phosphate-dependent enzyme [Citricoccus sp.]HRO93626.1 aminotransferase class I/II-fold pyridoxal phosphate-dependent enzyme [Citricoccus sp.]
MGTTAPARGPQPDDTGPTRHPSTTRDGRPEPWRRTAAAAGLLAGGVPTPTVFEAMTALATRHGAVNLGQGSPDEDGPAWIRDRAAEAIRTGADRANQYAPGLGLPVLRQAVSAHQRRHYGLELDPDRQVLVTTGATEGIAAALLALVGPGDGVVAFEPYYDSYAAMTALAGARFTAVPLRPPHFLPEPEALERALGPDTRVVVLNTPHNPTGVVPDPVLLGRLVEVCARHGVLILSDEVYEHLVYDGRHHPVSAVPGAWERTLTVSSAGKSFSLTGWKVGWVTGPAELVAAVRAVKQFLTYSTGPAYQSAIAGALADGDVFLAGQRDRLRASRDRLLAGLGAAGLDPVVPAAGYFTVTDLSAVGLDDAAAATEALAARAGVVGIPVSALCTPGPGTGGPEGTAGGPDDGDGDGARRLRSWMRWAFCKPMDTIEDAVRRLAALPAVSAG